MKVTKQTQYEFSKEEIEALLVSRLNIRPKSTPLFEWHIAGDMPEKVIVITTDSIGPEETVK